MNGPARDALFLARARFGARIGVDVLTMYKGTDLDLVANHHYGIKRRGRGLFRESDAKVRARCRAVMTRRPVDDGPVLGVGAPIRAPRWFVVACVVVCLLFTALLITLLTGCGPIDVPVPLPTQGMPEGSAPPPPPPPRPCGATLTTFAGSPAADAWNSNAPQAPGQWVDLVPTGAPLRRVTFTSDAPALLPDLVVVADGLPLDVVQDGGSYTLPENAANCLHFEIGRNLATAHNATWSLHLPVGVECEP